jgi:hypothetical protein
MSATVEREELPSTEAYTAEVVPVGAPLFFDVETFCRRFIAYSSIDAAVAHTLWLVHAHCMQAWESTPRIAFLSPEPGSGKTRALEVSELLVPNPVEAVNVTAAYLFRKISDKTGVPTILYDEIDTVFGAKSKDNNEEIRGVLNAGHRRGAVAGRCVMRGKTVEIEELPAYCAVAMAGLGHLPDTLLSRCVLIQMRRRAPNELVEPFRRRIHAADGHALRDRLAHWAEPMMDRLTQARPQMPPGIEDRNADVWESLLALADAAGGHWPERARVAAVALVAASKGSQASLGIRLLADLRNVLSGTDQLPTKEILDRLCSIEEAPWIDLKGSPLDSRRLANLLRDYGVKSKNLRTGGGGGVQKGYTAEDLHDAWLRYLPSSPIESATSATSATNGHCQRCAGEGCVWCEPESPS